MQTRSINTGKPEIKTENNGNASTIDNAAFDLNSLPRPKPVEVGDIAGILAAAKAAPAAPKEVEIVSSEKNEIDLVAVASSEYGSEYVRQELPSLGVPYAGKRDLHMKTITIPVLSKLHAANKNNSLTMLIDALNSCVADMDLRNLTPSDFTFVMYWLRDNSLPRSPLKIKYITRYNNEVEISTRASNMTITELNMTLEEAAEWRSKGIVFPTVRDAELIHRNTELPEDMQWMLEYAQYIEYIPGVDILGDTITDYSDYVERKFARLEELGLDIIPEIDKFSLLINHGINEKIKVVDTKFDPLVYAKFCEDKAREIITALKGIPQEEVASAGESLLMLAQQAHEFVAIARDMRKRTAEGEKIKAEEEVVEVTISATDFFP